VRLFLDPAPEDPRLYEPSVEPEWVNDENHERGGYWLELEAPLLMIKTRPRRGFTHLRNRPRRPGEMYHVPLCFTNELHRFDLRDRGVGVRLGLAEYEKLRQRYHGRAAVLRGRAVRDTFELDRRSVVEGSTLNIANDAAVRSLHDAGRFHDRPLHVSM
jgi:hypothetical protein